MPARKQYKVDIDVVPYLSIMAIVLKLICLILIVMVMRIAINPAALKVIRYTELYQPPERAGEQMGTSGVKERQIARVPVYFDCNRDQLHIQPLGVSLSPSELREKGGIFEETLHRIETNSANEFAILIARPNSQPMYRFVRREIAARKMHVGYDVLEQDVFIDWKRALSALQVKLDNIDKMRKSIEVDKDKQSAPGAKP